MAITWIFATATTKIIYDAPRIVQEMHVWSPAFKEAHHNEAMRIQKGEMSPIDYMVRFMLGKERFKEEMKTAFEREEAMAEEKVTKEALTEVEKNY